MSLHFASPGKDEMDEGSPDRDLGSRRASETGEDVAAAQWFLREDKKKESLQKSKGAPFTTSSTAELARRVNRFLSARFVDLLLGLGPIRRPSSSPEVGRLPRIDQPRLGPRLCRQRT